MNDSLHRQELLFTEVLALPIEARAAYLERICAGDGALRRSVEELLRAHCDAGSLLGTPTALAPELAPERRASGESELQRIGRYSIIQKLGEGGAGIVYEAEQEVPVRRRVALKVMKPGMDTSAAITRFEAERQALALMEHPNIAQVFDAGSTANGRLYFVMELVRGIRITAYCDQSQLSPRQRLQLFIQVCHAVQHAHQKGIIHRDLKPSNILVTQHDGAPVPKVIDFGIAKATQGKLTEHTLQTTFTQLVGTPQYMSPEQAAGSGADIDTRSDIYSLGVLLYELLTGQTPFDAHELLHAGINAMQRAICEREPPRPSVRLSTTEHGALAAIAANRGSEPPKLVHLLRGDLDWIVMKALEKDRGRRYATANEFAHDVEHHLHDEPVAARPASALYRFQKYIRRHKAAAATLAAVFVAVAVGLAATLISFHRVVVAQQETERQRVAAINALAESDAVTSFLEDTLASANPRRLGYDVTVRKVLDAVSPTVEKHFSDRPLLEARLHETIGQTYSSLAIRDAAESHLRKATDIRIRELGPSHPLTFRVQARLIGLNRDSRSAETAIETILAIYEGDDRYPAQDKVYAYRQSSQFCADQGRFDEALIKAQQAVELARTHLKPTDPESLWSQINLAVTYWYRGDFAAARDAHLAVLALSLPEDDPARRYALGGAGLMEVQLGQYAAAESHTRELQAYVTRVYGPDHPTTLVGSQFLGMVLAHRGHAREGLEILETVRKADARIYGEDSLATAKTSAFMVYALGQAGRPEEAVALGQKIWVNNRAHLMANMHFCDMVADLANIEVGLERCDDAERLCREVMSILATLPPRPYTLSRIRIALAGALSGTGRFSEAEQQLRENDAMLGPLTFDVREQRQLTAAAFVSLYNACGKREEARFWRKVQDELPRPE